MTGWGSKRWDLCQIRGCVRLTKSGEKERDLDKRWCSFHEPKRLSKALKKMMEGRMKRAVCVQQPKVMCEAPFPVKSEKCAVVEARCTTPGLRCFDPDWKWKRKRCSTAAPKSKAVGQVPVGREVKNCVVCGAEMVDTSVALCEDCS